MTEIEAKDFETVKKLLAEQVSKKKFDPEDIHPDTDLTTLGLDSLDVAELVINMEEAFGLPEVSQDEMMEIKTVKDLHDLIVSKKK